MVLARSCALSAVSAFMAQGLERKANTVRQQLREFCYEARAKRGGPRQEVQVETCFAPLLTWVLSWWEGNQLVPAIAATALGARFVVLTVSVVYRGCAIPVAWTVLAGNTKHAWRGEWLRMLHDLEGFTRNQPAWEVTQAGINASATCSHEYPPAKRRLAKDNKDRKTSRAIARQRCPKVLSPLANANCSEVEAIVGMRWSNDCARQLIAACKWLRPIAK